MTNPARPPNPLTGTALVGGGPDGQPQASPNASGFVPITPARPVPAAPHPPTFAGNDIQRIAKKIDAGVLPARVPGEAAPPGAFQGTELASPVAPPPFQGTELASPVAPPPFQGTELASPVSPQAAPPPSAHQAPGFGAGSGHQAPFAAPASTPSPSSTPLVPEALAAASNGPDPYLGKTLDGRYLVEKILGEGGMGVVYAGRHTIIGKRVAIKILRSEYMKDQEILDRFVLEAKAASSIGNPHIVDISDFGRLADGGTYFVMEFLDGESLGDAMTIRVAGAIQPRPIEVDRLSRITLEICDGLGAAHERGIVHRDLKPDNIFLVKRGAGEFVKILDFGIAKVSGSPTQKLTRAGAVFGTPQYMSPEQAAGATVDHRADIYALGVILYEMVSGQLPFDGDNFMGILTMHMYKAPVPVRALVNTASCPPGLEAVIQKCLQKRPEQRYQSMAELAEDIRRLMASQAPHAVADLMARPNAGGVPQDYFKSAQHAIVPAAPAQGAPKPWPIWVYVGGMVAAAAIVAGILLVRRAPHGGAGAATAATTAAMAPPLPSAGDVSGSTTASSAVSAPPPTSSAAKTKVTLEVSPKGASVKRDGAALSSPVVELASGEKASIEVSAQGYEPTTVIADGTQSTLKIALEPEKKKGASPTRPPAGSGKHNGSGVVETW